MFQTGYLTIKESRQYGNLTAYLLDFPNLEVKMSVTDTISAALLSSRPVYERQKIDLYHALATAAVEKIAPVFSVPFCRHSP